MCFILLYNILNSRKCLANGVQGAKYCIREHQMLPVILSTPTYTQTHTHNAGGF